MNPEISLIIPVFNREEIVKKTLDSIRKQTFENWECILVDDESTDNTLETLKSYSELDNRFRYFERNRLPKGPSTCRNIGLEKVKGKYIMYLDSDDLLFENTFEQRLNYFKNYEGDIDVGFFPTCYQQKEDYPLVRMPLSIEDEFKTQLKFRPVANVSTGFWKKEVYDIPLSWNENLMLWEDCDLYVRLALLNQNVVTFFDALPDVFIRTNFDDRNTFIFSVERHKNWMKVLTTDLKLMENTPYHTEFYKNGRSKIIREVEEYKGNKFQLFKDLEIDFLKKGDYFIVKTYFATLNFLEKIKFRFAQKVLHKLVFMTYHGSVDYGKLKPKKQELSEEVIEHFDRALLT